MTDDKKINPALLAEMNRCINMSDKQKKISPGSYDKQYIDAYLADPVAGKLEALRVSGYPNPTRGRAWEIHKRLAKDIDKELDQLLLQDGALGRGVLVALAKTSTSDSVKFSSASKLMDYAGKSKADKLIIEHRSTEQIDTEIEAIQMRILEAQGDTPESELH